MGRKFNALIFALVLALLVPGVVCAQPPAGRRGGRQLGAAPARPVPIEAPPKSAKTLSPEDRQRFTRNAERWLQMNAEERKIMREREKLRRQRIQQEAETALRESGLRLDPEKRAAFESRYLQERTRLEHNMHQELQAKRQKETSELVDRLKKEFQSEESKSTARGSATVSPKPGD